MNLIMQCNKQNLSMQCNKRVGSCLGTKPKHEPPQTKPSKLLPHWHLLPKWTEKLRRPMQYVFLQQRVCISQKYEWNAIHKNNDNQLKEDTILRTHGLRKYDMAQRHTKCEVGNHKVRRAKGKHDIMIRVYRSVLKKIEKLPKICALFRIFVCKYNVTSQNFIKFWNVNN